MRHARLPYIALLTLAAAGACGADRRPTELQAAPARRLVGVWDVRFHLDRPMQLVSAPRAREARGTIALIESRGASSLLHESAPALNYGVYDIDFGALGFDPRDRGRVPTAVGRATTDSVHIVLTPESDKLSVVMDGRFAGDSVAGSWTVATRTAGGGGPFVMRRRD